MLRSASGLGPVSSCIAALFFAACATGGSSPDASTERDASSNRNDAGPALDAFVPLPEDGGGALDASLDAGTMEPDSGALVGAPLVDGEPRADHRRPSWVWTVPEGAEGFRVRIDDGAWETLDLGTTHYTAPSDLSDGLHRFEVQARDVEGRYGPSGHFETTVELIERPGDWWWRTDRVLATTPLGHPAAISAHNAYSDTLSTAEANRNATLTRLHEAQNQGADLLELDLVDAGDGVPRIAHDDNGNSARARLVDVLDDPQLAVGDQILFLELKETAPTEAFMRALLDLIAERRASYARAGRPIVLRAFESVRASIDLAKTLLESPDYVLIRPYVRLSILFSRNAATPAKIRDAAASGFHMVEFEYRTYRWPAYAALARSLGLGVNVWTVPVSFGEVFVANAREIADAITVDYPIAAARSVVTDDNSLFLVDVSQETDASVTSVNYLRTNRSTFPLPVNGTGQPLLRIGSDSDPLIGGRLVFESSASRSAALYDGDTRPGEGVFLGVLVRFTTLSLADGTTKSIVAKTNSGAWGLELHNPSGTAATILRFGVYVDGSYRYATVPASRLTTTRAHFITAAYDGDGGVRMWIDNDDSGVTVPTTRGGIVNNNVPIRLGADPEEVGARYYFDGEIQMAFAQAWGHH